MIDQMRRALGHPAAPAARAEAAPFARKGEQPLEPAGAAAHPGEPVRQHPAAHELVELGAHEGRQPDTVRPRFQGGGERGKMRAHDAVEHARRRRARHVDAALHGGAP